MRVFRTIAGKTFMDRKKNEHSRQTYKTKISMIGSAEEAGLESTHKL